MLDERKTTILRAVVEEYIGTAQPVGSSHVAKASGVTVSSATVRNDMAALEQDGYLAQPHTSAGRVPTEKAYRYFVDQLGQPGRLGSTEAQRVRAFFASAHGELEAMLQDTTRLLADLTHLTSVIVGPGHEVATIRSIQLVGLAPGVALAVTVLSNGAVDKHTVELVVDDVDDGVIAAAATRLAGLVIGRPFGELATVAVPGSEPVDEVVRAVLAAMTTPDHDAEHVYIGGQSRVASAFDAVAQVSEVLHILEQQVVVVSLLSDVLERGLSVAIGSETGLESLTDCAVVVAPYEVDGEPAGTVGILGPTRMDYAQALATVAVVSRRLGTTLSEP
jgi:heat-inducible transcriptional repressor